MRVSYLELKNYRRFKELKIQFPDGIVGILGMNGVGKSTMIEAIAWALFGNVEEVVRTSREGVRRSGAGQNDSCRAILEFELGGTEYRIEREMGGRNLSMRAELRTKDNVLADTDKSVRIMVQKLLGMDYKSFFTSVFAVQKELNALQKVAPGERKKTVLRMLRIDGVDDVLAAVRADKRDVSQKIQGAERTLFTEDGRERDQVLKERIPVLESTLESASRDLEKAEIAEGKMARQAEDLRRERDELKKDVDAYNTSLSDLKAKRTEIAERKDRERNIRARMADARVKLQKLRSLEKDEARWKEIYEVKENLDKEKTRAEKAAMIMKEIADEEKDESRRQEELLGAKANLANRSELNSKIEETESARTECQTKTAEITGRIGELNARVKDRSAAVEKDREKLEEIRAAGRDGVCPTCERTLNEAYELLVRKLTESSTEAQKQFDEETKRAIELQEELKTISKKEEALRKKRLNLDHQLSALAQTESAVAHKEAEIQKLGQRLSMRRKSLLEIGEIKFDDAQYRKVVEEHERLRHAHENYLKLKALEAQAEQHAKDLEDILAAIKRASEEEQQLESIMKTFEPKTVLHESVIKNLDEKTEQLNKAKDIARKLSDANQKAKSELEHAKKEMSEVARVRKDIDRDRETAAELATLEDVVSSFKDHLIGRVAPVLSELTSGLMESMTDGKYSKVQLDDNYEMQIEDQGTPYPISRFSGGESDLANLSLRLAISRVIADRTGASPVNFLILDEIFGSQDANRKRSLMTALSRLSAQFRQILLITHIEDVKDSMNYIIRVEEQEDGTSRAELAT